jgi:hypothetical protein
MSRIQSDIIIVLLLLLFSLQSTFKLLVALLSKTVSLVEREVGTRGVLIRGVQTAAARR